MNEHRGGNWWMENLLRPAIIAGMMACLAAPLVKVLEWVMPGWHGAYFVGFAFMAALEGILSERALRKRRITGYGYLASRGAEALILLLLLKVASYVPVGLDQLWTDALLWPSDPDRFLTNLDLLTGMLFLILWVGALHVGRQVTELDAGEGKLAPPPDRTSTEYYLWLTQPPPVRERQEAIAWLGEMYLWGGIVILVASAAIFFLLPTVALPAIPTMLYFALGVALLSQARFSVTHTGWEVQGIPVQQGIARRWLLWALIFLLGVTAVALMLPADYAMGPALALLYLIGIIGQVTMLILSLIPYLLALLLSRLMPSAQEPPPPPLDLESLIPAGPTVRTGSPPWLDVLASTLFWVVIFAIVGYALVRVLKDRFGLFAWGEGAGETWWGRLLAWWRALRRQWQAWQRGVQVRLARRRGGLKDVRPVPGGLARLLSLRRLPPRELVRYFYLSAARRAAQAGGPRGPGQTPYEYRAALDRRFPDLEPDLAGLTDAFVQARYSPQQIERTDAEAVKPLWQRIKAALRRWRAKKPGD